MKAAAGGAAFAIINTLITSTIVYLVYTSAILVIINRSFGMIYEVPNKVLRWIGGQGDGSSEEQHVGKVGSSLDSGYHHMVGAGKGSFDTASGSTGHAIQKSGEDWQKEGPSANVESKPN